MSGKNLLRARTPPGRAGVRSRLPASFSGRPQIPSGPAIDWMGETRLTAQLIVALFAYAKDLSDLNESKELLPRHSPWHPRSRRSGRGGFTWRRSLGPTWNLGEPIQEQDPVVTDCSRGRWGTDPGYEPSVRAKRRK
jgi:hypothetical protein